MPSVGDIDWSTLRVFDGSNWINPPPPPEQSEWAKNILERLKEEEPEWVVDTDAICTCDLGGGIHYPDCPRTPKRK